MALSKATPIITGAGDASQNLTTALMFVYRHDRMRGGDVISSLRKIPKVVVCDVMTGDFNLLVRDPADRYAKPLTAIDL